MVTLKSELEVTQGRVGVVSY